jgi:MinD-like ATPase involved in chromosome partitioning or flagellar assembly
MNETMPDDIAVLCSHVNVERGRYHVFTRDSARPTPPAGASAETSDAPDARLVPSEIGLHNAAKPPAITGPRSIHHPHAGTNETGATVCRPSLERRVLRSILRDLDQANIVDHEHNPTSLAERTLSVFAASGGAGATTVSASVARLFSRWQQRTVIIDGRQESVLPFYFGSRSGSHLGRSFVALQDASDAPVHILTRDIWDLEHKSADTLSCEWLERGLSKSRGEFDCAVIDVWPNLPVSTFDQFCAPGLAVIIAVPDLNSILGVRKIAKYLEERGLVSSPLYVVNKFDERQPLHVEMLQWFERQFPQNPVVTLRRTDEASEALAEGLTVIDYAPQSGIAEDYSKLTDVIRHVWEGRSSSAIAMSNALRNK